MAFGAGGGSPDEVKGDINVTPLVDVCLVLLIIFMVVTPMLQQGVDVLLPNGPHAEKKPGTEDDLVISIKQDGTVFVADKWIPAGRCEPEHHVYLGPGPRTQAPAAMRAKER